MKTIGVHSYKGGVSKTTTSLHLCGALVEQGLKVALLDMDPQGSATFLTTDIEDSHYPFDIYPDTVEALNADLEHWTTIVEHFQETGIDYLVCDYPPGIPGAKINGRHDLVLVPFRPCIPDYEAAQRGMNSLDADTKVIPVLTMVDSSSPDHREFVSTVQEQFGDVPVIPRRAIFERANNNGSTIYSMNKNLYGLRPAKQAVNNLANKILEALKPAAKRKTVK